MNGAPGDKTRAPARVVLRDPARGVWLDFTSPRRVLMACRPEEVLPGIADLEDTVRREGWQAAGFISYEAAPAFDPSLAVRPDPDGFPLLWFGLFERGEEIELPRVDGSAELAALDWTPTVTVEEYRNRLGAIRDFIRAGDTYQANYTYRLRSRTGADPWRLFLQLAGGAEPPPFAAFVHTGDWAVCSASPELFLRLEGDAIESRPMKGTAARGRWLEEDRDFRAALAASAKERAENLMIVDMVRNDLGRIAAPGSVRTPALFELERYPTVWQMTSTVRARTDESLGRILQAAFPPASITGAPKRRTMDILANLETSPRRVYTGAIGHVSPGRRAQFNVAIRTLLLHTPSGRAEYGLGGGIVWDSLPEREYEESRIKARALRPRAQDFDLLETLRWSPGEGFALLDGHLRRLARSADYFGFRADPDRVRDELMRRAAELPAHRHRVRVRVSRRGQTQIEVSPWPAAALRFGTVAPAARPVDSGEAFLYHKTTHREVYAEALGSAPAGCDDVLLFNEAGELTESTIANVAVLLDGAWYTPPVRCGLLPGVRRAWLLERGRLRERVIRLEEALASPCVCLLNSLRGFQRVRIRARESSPGARQLSFRRSAAGTEEPRALD